MVASSKEEKVTDAQLVQSNNILRNWLSLPDCYHFINKHTRQHHPFHLIIPPTNTTSYMTCYFPIAIPPPLIKVKSQTTFPTKSQNIFNCINCMLCKILKQNVYFPSEYIPEFHADRMSVPTSYSYKLDNVICSDYLRHILPY